MLIVAALGGHALMRPGEQLTAETQRAHLKEAAVRLAELARRHELVITHGNGPQVGLLALQSESVGGVPSFPLDVLGAESEGMIGFMIEESLRPLLGGRSVATLLTLVEVDVDDPAFGAPSKPIGPVFGADRARELAERRGWTMRKSGDGYRRVVASPEPRRVLELATIQLLVGAGVTVICAGGGGIPVVRTPEGGLRGVEAVIDKDLSSALLASAIGADRLLLLTDVEAVVADWPEPAERVVRRASPRAMRELGLEEGSIAPKVEAACRFADATGRPAAIGALEQVDAILRGESGTTVVSGAAREEAPRTKSP